MKGYVKKFNRMKGYGFIVTEPVSVDVMFHLKNVNEKAHANQIDNDAWLEFDFREGSRGAYAMNVRLIAPFTWMDLPHYCSHRFAVRCETTHRVDVFDERADAMVWCAQQIREVLGE